MKNKKESLSIMIVKTLLAVIIFAGVGTIIIGGGLLIGNYNELSKSVVKEMKETTLDDKTVEPIDETKDEIADWQTYRNEEYGFEVKYPENWSVVIRGNYQVHFLDIENLGFDTYSEPGEGNIFITMDKLQDNQDLPSQYYSKSTIIIDGNSAVRYEGIKGGHDQLNPSIIYTSIYLIKNDKKIKFNFSNRVSDKNDDKYITIFNQILSSFKFIEK